MKGEDLDLCFALRWGRCVVGLVSCVVEEGRGERGEGRVEGEKGDVRPPNMVAESV